jgi:hypothetical protein
MSSQSTFTRLYLVTAFNSGYSSAVFSLNVSWSRILALEILQLPLAAGKHSTTAHWTVLHSLSELSPVGRVTVSEWTHREHRLHHLFYCCVTSPRTRMLRTLHSNDFTCYAYGRIVCYCVLTIPSKDWYLQSHILATGLYATIYIHIYIFKIYF